MNNDIDVWIKFIYQFENQRNYFECHEIMEELWKKNTTDLSKNNHYVVLLQFSVSLHHLQKSNYQGAQKLLNSLFSHLDDHSIILLNDVIDYQDFTKKLTTQQKNIENKKYQHISLKWRIC